MMDDAGLVTAWQGFYGQRSSVKDFEARMEWRANAPDKNHQALCGRTA
jgi:hypothetical protein